MGICHYICASTFGDFFLWLCRLWGLATLIATWGIGAEVSFYGHYLGFYLLGVAVLVTFLEIEFLITQCVDVCISADSICKTCWNGVKWLDNWKKAVLYLALSVPCFIQPHSVWLAAIAGTMLILCGVFNILKTFKTNVEKERKKVATTPSYDKFDEIHDDMDIEDDDDNDDASMQHSGTMIVSMDNDIGDQQEILEV